MKAQFHQLVAVVLASATAALAQDQLDFPVNGELDVVFPRNGTYAVEAPFPIVLGFQNSPALMSFATKLYWTVTCSRFTLHGTGYLDGERFIAPPADPWYYINATDTLQQVRDGEEDGPPGSKKGQFGYWLNYDVDSCVLAWEFLYFTTCKRLSDGALEISGGKFPRQMGNVTFTIAPNGTRPRDAIRAYKGCPMPGFAVTVNKNHTGCADVDNEVLPEPQPCLLDVEAVASSLAEAVVTPTTSVTDMPTATTATTTGSPASTTGSGESGPASTEGPGSGADGGGGSGNGDDGSQAGPGLAAGSASGIVALLAAAVVAVAAPLVI